MKNQVKIEGNGNYKYITIYEVRAHVIERDEVITEDRFLNREDAEKDLEFCRENHKNLYDHVWIMEQMVWC